LPSPLRYGLGGETQEVIEGRRRPFYLSLASDLFSTLELPGEFRFRDARPTAMLIGEGGSMIIPAFCKCIVRIYRQQFVAITVVAVATGASLGAAAQTSASTSSGLSDPAITALIGVIVSAVVSLILAWFAAQAAVRSEHAKRQSELALKISDMVSAADDTSRRSAMRRFAVGLVKIVGPEKHEEYGNVHFIPMNSRVTVGRSDDNDIVLTDKDVSLSRWHCGFISDQQRVWLDDFKSSNGTKVGGQKISGSQELKSGDEITLGPFKLHYQTIHPNTILAQ
jgi:hypothetical protein